MESYILSDKQRDVLLMMSNIEEVYGIYMSQTYSASVFVFTNDLFPYMFVHCYSTLSKTENLLNLIRSVSNNYMSDVTVALGLFYV